MDVPMALAQEAWHSSYQEAEAFHEEENYEAVLEKEADLYKLIASIPDTALANVYYFLGDSYYYLGELEEALVYFEKEKVIRAKQGTDNEDYEALLSSLAAVYREAAQYRKALDTYKEMRQLDSLLFGIKDDRYIATLIDIAKTYEQFGKYNQSESTYEYLLKKVDKSTIPYATILSDYGSFCTLIGKYSQSQKLLDQSLALFKKHSGGQSLEYMKVLMNKASYYSETGRFPDAEEIYLKALDRAQREPDPDMDEINATALNNLAIVYRSMGRFDESIKMLMELRTLDEANFGKSHPVYANTLNNIALVQTDQGKYAEAEQNFEQAMEIVRASLGENYLYATSLNSLALMYRKTKNFTQALPNAKSARDLARKNLGPTHPNYAQYTYNLGNLYFSMQDLKMAEPLLLEALKIREDQLGKNHPKYGETTNKVAIYYWKQNNFKKAESYFEETFDNYFTQIDTYFPFMSEQEKAKFYNTKIRVSFEEFNSYAVSRSKENPSLLGEMYDYQLSTKALIMYATNKVRARIMNSGDSLLMKKYEIWVGQKEQLSRMYSMSKEDLKAQNLSIDSVVQSSNLLEKELSKASSVFEETYARKKASWKDVQKTLKPGEAALEMIRFRHFLPDSSGVFSHKVYYAALLVTSSTKNAPELILLENGADLEKKYLASYRNSIRYKIAESFSYKHFWEPIGQQLKSKGIKKVFFSPDGVYSQVSINTLRNPETGNYVIDEIEVCLILNTKDLLAISSNSKSNKSYGKATFFGFPNYNKGMEEDQELSASIASQVANTVSLDRSLRGSLSRYIAGNQLLALLPGTKTEIESIAKLYQLNNQTVETHIGDLAVEERIKIVNSPSSLHIATHGFFMEDIPAADGDENKYVENPLLRSGLILAGANSYLTGGANDVLQDGILTAYEAMNLNLDKTDLVVLSACQTGLGEVKNGEGVYGLQRSFQIAGAKTVVMSMWSVDDQATQELMTLFYGEWIKSGDKQQAFHKAQQQLKAKYKEPFYWGAFVMVGN